MRSSLLEVSLPPFHHVSNRSFSFQCSHISENYSRSSFKCRCVLCSLPYAYYGKVSCHLTFLRPLLSGGKNMCSQGFLYLSNVSNYIITFHRCGINIRRNRRVLFGRLVWETLIILTCNNPRCLVRINMTFAGDHLGWNSQVWLEVRKALEYKSFLSTFSHLLQYVCTHVFSGPLEK